MNVAQLRKWLNTRSMSLPQRQPTDTVLTLAKKASRAEDHLRQHGEATWFQPTKSGRWPEEDTVTLLKFMQKTVEGPVSVLELVPVAQEVGRTAYSCVYRIHTLLYESNDRLNRVLF